MFHLSCTEARELLRAVTFRKLWNAAKVMLSFYVARALRKPLHWGLPITIGIEPTTACNLQCPHCPSGLRSFTRPTGRLEVERYKAVVDELHKDLMYLILYFQGEPYIHKQFLEMVAYATQKGVYTMSSTNAHFLTPEVARQTVRAGLGRLIISLDGLTQETYEQYRVGGQLDKVLEGTRNLVAAKRELGSHRPFIDLQFIAFQHNLHEVEAVKKLGKELGVDRVSIKTAQVYDFENASGWIPEREDLSRYKKGPGGKYILRHRLFNHCWKLWHSAEITWDGRVLPCCFDKDARYEMGRVPETRFRTIWRSGPYRDFRQKILFSRQKIDICSNCSEGSKVWA